MALSLEMREGVFAAYGRKCLRCGSTDRLSVDHVHPVACGGTDAPENLQVLCKSCNSSKNVKTIDYRPAILPVVPVRRPKPAPKPRVPRLKEPSTPVLLKMPEWMYREVAALAKSERRMIGGQILYMIDRALAASPAQGPQPDPTKPVSSETREATRTGQAGE